MANKAADTLRLFNLASSWQSYFYFPGAKTNIRIFVFVWKIVLIILLIVRGMEEFLGWAVEEIKAILLGKSEGWSWVHE